MDIETKIKNFIDYAREVCLQSLLLADNIKVDLKSQDNLYEVERIDNQLKRVNEFESLGMWECAAYFLSSSGPKM